MLTGIKFKNYKAFQEGHLEIKPITILLGANSVGKSSLIQLFLMLQETALAQNYKSALKLHGGFFSLGEGINLFRKKDSNNTLHFEIEFREPAINETIRHEFFARYFEEIINYCYYILTRFSNNDKDIRFIQEKFVRDKSSKRHFKEIGILHSGIGNFVNVGREDIVALIDRANEILTKLKDKEVIKEVTVAEKTFMFNGPDINSDEVALIHRDDRISVLAKQNEYLYCKFSSNDGRKFTGWVFIKDLEKYE